MLVLARQINESIVIGNEIEVKVVDIRHDKVRLGISAPKTTSVHRREVYDSIKREENATGRNWKISETEARVSDLQWWESMKGSDPGVTVSNGVWCVSVGVVYATDLTFAEALRLCREKYKFSTSFHQGV